MRTEGKFWVRFFMRKSIGFPKPYRVTSSFFALRKLPNISIQFFDDNESFPGLYGGLYTYGQNLPYKFKIRIVIFRLAT